MNPLPPIDQQRILAIYAHPDDECYCSGGTLAKYHALGAETMVISATRGQAGQINDTYRTTRRTLGEQRKNELMQSCKQLGVDHVECWDYLDGGLEQADQQQLIGDIVYSIRKFRPHIVITFGLDGAYGHPDHVAIGRATTMAFQIAGNPSSYPSQISESVFVHKPDRLYHAHFPNREVLLLEELAYWLVARKDHFQGTLDFVHGLSLFAEESTMLHYTNDFIEVKWFPPGFCIIEQGETSDNLYVILSGTVDVQKEDHNGELTHVDDLTVGEFFGEIGIATQHTRNAYVIAKEPVTCFVLSPGKPTKYAGRGTGAIHSNSYVDDQPIEDTGLATHVIDVTDYVMEKISAIAEHRTQYPIKPDMFPLDMLQRLFGHEYFVQIYPESPLETRL